MEIDEGLAVGEMVVDLLFLSLILGFFLTSGLVVWGLTRL